MFGATVFGLLGIAIAKLWCEGLQCLVGIVPLVILALPVGKAVDRKWGRLRTAGEVEPAAAAATAVCEECKSVSNITEMIVHNGLWYCGRCKPILLQKLVETSPRPPVRRKHALRTWWFWFWILFAVLATWVVATFYLFNG
jgi:hypothetical protein